jgi:membrane associated rhomboid family serine protease
VHSNNGHNGGDGENGSGNENDAPNVIRLPDAKERKKREESGLNSNNRVRVKVTMGHGQTGYPSGKTAQDPMINLPPFTKWLVLVLVCIHAGMTFFLDPAQRYQIIDQFGFIPAYYTGAVSFSGGAIWGPITYAFLHGGWSHLGINAVMLVAFGAGLERWMGWKRMALLMLGTSIVAAIIQAAVAFGSDTPVIGASGAISGMFAAAMIMLQQQGRAPMGKYGLMPFIALWIGVSVLFGMMGGPSGESIAWPAHIGGFLAGFILIKPILKMKI